VLQLVDHLTPSTRYLTNAVEPAFFARDDAYAQLPRVTARSKHHTPKSRRDESLG
jgi:hypothetical protein